METMDIPPPTKKNKTKQTLSRQKRGKKGRKSNKQRNGRGGTSATEKGCKTTYKPLAVSDETKRWKPHNSCLLSLAHDDAPAAEVGSGKDVLEVVDDETVEKRESRLLLRLLNKLTPTNFEIVVPAYIAETTSMMRNMAYGSNCLMLNAIAMTIMTRAALDPRYAAVHAQLCARLAADLSPPTARPASSATNNNDDNSPLCFREALLQTCRRDVDEGCAAAIRLEISNLQRDERQVARRRYNGAISFIGELYNHHVFSLDENLSILDTLLRQATTTTHEDVDDAHDDDHESIIVDDELALEGICVLLTTCGKLLEAAVPAFEAMQHCWVVLQDVVDAAEQIGDHPERNTISFRMAHLVRELLELRSAAWVAARYGARQRNEMVAKPLLEEDRVLVVRNYVKRRNKGRKGKSAKQVHFAAPDSSHKA